MQGGGIKAAQDLAFAPRGKVELPQLVRQDIPELKVKVAAAPAAPTAPAAPPQTPPAARASDGKKKSGCGCQSSPDDLPGGILMAAGIAGLVLRRRR